MTTIAIDRVPTKGGMHTGRPYVKNIYHCIGPDGTKFDNDSIVTLRSNLRRKYGKVTLEETWKKVPNA